MSSLATKINFNGNVLDNGDLGEANSVIRSHSCFSIIVDRTYIFDNIMGFRLGQIVPHRLTSSSVLGLSIFKPSYFSRGLLKIVRISCRCARPCSRCRHMAGGRNAPGLGSHITHVSQSTHSTEEGGAQASTLVLEEWPGVLQHRPTIMLERSRDPTWNR